MKKIIYVLMVLVLVGSVSADWCYQETANDSSVTSTNPSLADGNCGLKYTGSYSVIGTWTNPENMYDGDWDTSTSLSSDGEFYINYTKPPNSFNTSLWQIKYLANPTNYSLSSCWNGYSNKVVLEINVSGSYNTDWNCHNGSDWLNLLHTVSIRPQGFREEAMWWNITIPPPTIFIRHENKEVQIPYTYFERKENDAWVINLPKILFRRFVRWISG